MIKVGKLAPLTSQVAKSTFAGMIQRITFESPAATRQKCLLETMDIVCHGFEVSDPRAHEEGNANALQRPHA